MKLPKLPQDKANHFIYGALIYLLASLILEPWPSIFIVMSLAFFKEFYDVQKRSDFGILDFIATTLGGLTILISQTIN